ncbi:hypothetical protein C0992_013129 [Termitomyces sp. T32_za158]|nr:hypothetical protein C0992_013129 [Termitomyces sp. T32_za158]
MAEFHSLSGELPPIPDNLTIPQFFFSDNNLLRPVRPHAVPWLIDDETGLTVDRAELSRKTRGLANAMSTKWNIGVYKRHRKEAPPANYFPPSGQGDVVCIFSPNNIGYPVCIWAAHTLGGVITPANPAYKADELVHQLRTSGASLLIIHPDFLSTALTAAKEVGLSEDRIIFMKHPIRETISNHFTLDQLVEYGLCTPVSYTEFRLKSGEGKTTLAFLSFSSGTTGKPKAVAIPHYSVIANVIQMVFHNKLNEPNYKNKHMAPGDVAIAVLPFFHIYGLVVNLHFLLFAGLSIVVVPKFSLDSFLDSIVRYRVTHLFVVPPQILLLCKHPSIRNLDLSHVKYCISGAAPLSGELLQVLRRFLPNAAIGQGYGLTETCTTVTMLPPTQSVGTVGSSGRFIPGIRAKVVKEDGSLAREGEQGELVVTGPSMALRYINDEVATKETFINGWVRTGDEVIIRNGDVFVVDRLKVYPGENATYFMSKYKIQEMMKVRGFQVAPAELEGHLLTHPDVTDACVVSVLDDYSGELPFAYVVLSDTAARRVAGNPQAAAEAKAVIGKHVADAKVYYKHLKGGIEFIDAIPKNPSGKILRRVLRDEARKLKGNGVMVGAKL